MEDHLYAADTLVEEREALMVPPGGGKKTLRKAHFLKPLFTRDHLLLPPSPASLLSSKPNFQNLEKLILQSYKAYPSEQWKLWVQSLKPRYQDIWKQAGIYDAILASTYTIPKDKMLIFCLAEKWRADTNTFVFPWGEATITLEDVIYLGCFPVLGASFLTPLDDECNDIFDSLKKAHKFIRSCHAGNVSASSWMDYFMSTGNSLEHEAFLSLWMSQFVLVRPPDHIPEQAFLVAIHLSRGDKIALAPVVLACIYRDMRLLQNLVVETTEIESRVGLGFGTCHYDLVQMWVWERFMEVRPLPNAIERGEPRSARWNGVTNLTVDDVRTALDNARSSFLWRPYAIGSSHSILTNLYKDKEQWIVVDSDAVESFARCLMASHLIGLGYTEQYHPHRVAMQFGLDQHLPLHVVQSNESPASCYNRPIRGVKLYIPPRLFESDVSHRYMVWWKRKEVVTDSIHNEQQLSLVSCEQKRNVKSSATHGFLSGCVEERPDDYGLIGGLSNAPHMSRSRKTDIFGKRNDLEDDPVLNKIYDNVEEDNLTIAQIMNQSRKTDSPGKGNDLEDDPVLNNSYDNVKEHSLTIAQFLNRSSKADSLGKRNNLEDFPVLDNTSFDNVEENSLMIAQFLNRSSKADSPGKRNDLEDFLVLDNTSFDNVEEDSLTIAQFLNRSSKADSLAKRNDLEDFLVLDNTSFDDVEEDSLTIAQFLNRPRERYNFEKAGNVDDDLVLNTVTPALFSVCHESPKMLSCTSEAVELSAQIMPWSDEREKSTSSTEKQSELKEDAVVSRSLKFPHQPTEMSVHGMSSSDKHKQSKSSTERQTELQDAVVTSDDNIISINEECGEDTSELQTLGLKARISRLETIVSMIKAAKSGANSGGNLDK